MYIGFYDNINEYLEDNTYVARLSSNITCKDELFIDFKNKLEFPDYFGYNWDALYDCLTDLSWIRQKKIIIISERFPCLDEDSLKIYFKIIIDVLDTWSEDDIHNVKILFPTYYKDEINNLIVKIKNIDILI